MPAASTPYRTILQRENGMPKKFVLHPKLEQDTVPVTDLSFCTVRLMDDSRFPWIILVPKLADLREIHRLEKRMRGILMEEIADCASAMEREYSADKMNVAALGNMVPQLHIHIIARFEGDAAWPGPVWGVGEAEPYGDLMPTTVLRIHEILHGAG